MNIGKVLTFSLLVMSVSALPVTAQEPPVPRFSPQYMDTSVAPGTDFYNYAVGTWVKKNPVPADKSRWGGFMELQERNWFLIHNILESLTNTVAEAKSPAQQVRDFFQSAMDTNRLEKLGFSPLKPDLERIEKIKSTTDLVQVIGSFHLRGIGAGFGMSVSPDDKDSGYYAFYVHQGGLGLPDRDYYLNERFKTQLEGYRAHIARMFVLAGDSEGRGKSAAATVVDLETEMAKASKARADLRDPIANYHKFKVQEIVTGNPEAHLTEYLESLGVTRLEDIIVSQPEFFQSLTVLMSQRPIDDWKTYLKWHLLRSTAPFLNAAAEEESFKFYGTVLRDQQQQEPRWQRAAKVIDSCIGEALGQIYVERYFPPEARVRMTELVKNINDVVRDRLTKLDWMTEPTKEKALAKFAVFTQKIGHPEKFRDYSSIQISRDDYLGNVQRSALFESHRELVRIGRPVDRSEWHMTPQTVNAYFNPTQNEIVFPAGILQPPFFDLTMDDAVNYGAIGVVIGHEITHGYDDQGRKFDADGNLNDWWTEADAKAFEARAQKLVDQYNGYEILPGVHVNGKLTLGENIADLGGGSIAFEALQRALAKDPAKRKKIDGFTPEQRFFLSFSQVWRTNIRDAEARRLITVDPHSPGKFRAFGPHVNLDPFYAAFGIKEGDPLWLAPEKRAKIW